VCEPIISTNYCIINQVKCQLSDAGNSTNDVTVSSIATLGQWLAHYHKLHTQAHSLTDDTGDTGDTTDSTDHAHAESEDDKQEVKVVERHVRLTVAVCDRCRHLLTCGHAAVQSQCLDILASACIVLQGHQGQSLLLHPLVFSPAPNHSNAVYDAVDSCCVMCR
jgi:hypothetical protein